MYDGIKIECKLTDLRKWEHQLQMIGHHLEETGELIPYPSTANLNACTFSRIPGPPTKYTFQGSIHKFYQRGRENDNDFTLNDFLKTLKIFKNKFGIDEKYSKVINIEFGVNVQLPPGLSAQHFQKYLVSAYTKGFEKLNPKRPAVGYIAEFNEYSIKIYDKGFQATNGATDQLRIEIKVNRTRWLDQFNFKKGTDLLLTDLTNEHNISILGDILTQKVSSLILTPRQIDFKKLTQKEKITYLECRDARSWEYWNSNQRKRKRKQLARIFKKLNQPDPVDVLARLVKEKWQKLTTNPRCIRVKGSTTKNKNGAFSTLYVGGIRDILKKWGEFLNIPSLSCILFLVRGIPIFIPPPPKAQPGLQRWIELKIRGPPK